MTVTINGTTGITNDGGYTGDGVVFADTTPANTLVTTTAGNVGVGTSSPATKLDVNGVSQAIGFRVQGSTSVAGAGIWGLDSTLAFNAGSAERARIDSSGNLLVGTTSLGAWNTRLTISVDSGITKWSVGPSAPTGTQFIISSSASAGVYLATTSATSWTAISDERHKDIIEPITNAAEKVSTLRAVIGKYKADETNSRKSFLIAQDVLAVLPEAVDTSNPDRYGVAYTDLIPLLTAAIQEQQALIASQSEIIDAQESALTALTARVAALDASLDARITSLEGTQNV